MNVQSRALRKSNQNWNLDWYIFFAECQVENNRITELLEEIQILKEELQSKDQEIEHSQNFVEKYKKLRQKVSTIRKKVPQFVEWWV